MALPADREDALKAIEDEQQADFQKWQASVRLNLELDYANISAQTEQVSIMSRCYGKCMKPWADSLPCGQTTTDSCHLLNEGFLQTSGEIYSIFPNLSIPDDLLTSPLDASKILRHLDARD